MSCPDLSCLSPAYLQRAAWETRIRSVFAGGNLFTSSQKPRAAPLRTPAPGQALVSAGEDGSVFLLALTINDMLADEQEHGKMADLVLVYRSDTQKQDEKLIVLSDKPTGVWRILTIIISILLRFRIVKILHF